MVPETFLMRMIKRGKHGNMMWALKMDNYLRRYIPMYLWLIKWLHAAIRQLYYLFVNNCNFRIPTKSKTRQLNFINTQTHHRIVFNFTDVRTLIYIIIEYNLLGTTTHNSLIPSIYSSLKLHEIKPQSQCCRKSYQSDGRPLVLLINIYLHNLGVKIRAQFYNLHQYRYESYTPTRLMVYCLINMVRQYLKLW